MGPDLDSLVTRLYVTVDDLLIRYPHWAPRLPAMGISPQVSDAEMVTLAVIQVLLRFDTEARFLRYAHAHRKPWFPYLPARSGYSKRLRRSAELLAHGTTARPTQHQANTPPSHAAKGIRVPSEPTAPTPAGATTSPDNPPRQKANTPPSPPAGFIRAPSEPTAPSPAGATTNTGRPTLRKANTRLSQPATGARALSEPTVPSFAGISWEVATVCIRWSDSGGAD